RSARAYFDAHLPARDAVDALVDVEAIEVGPVKAEPDVDRVTGARRLDRVVDDAVDRADRLAVRVEVIDHTHRGGAGSSARQAEGERGRDPQTQRQSSENNCLRASPHRRSSANVQIHDGFRPSECTRGCHESTESNPGQAEARGDPPATWRLPRAPACSTLAERARRSGRSRPYGH